MVVPHFAERRSMLWDRWTFVESFLSTSLGFTKPSFSLYRVGRVGPPSSKVIAPEWNTTQPLHHTGWMDGWMDDVWTENTFSLYILSFLPVLIPDVSLYTRLDTRCKSIYPSGTGIERRAGITRVSDFWTLVNIKFDDNRTDIWIPGYLLCEN